MMRKLDGRIRSQGVKPGGRSGRKVESEVFLGLGRGYKGHWIGQTS